jgi:hypothetical protein
MLPEGPSTQYGQSLTRPDLPHFDAWLHVHGPDRVPSITATGLIEQIAAWESHAYGCMLLGIDPEPLLAEAHKLAQQRDRLRSWRTPTKRRHEP